MFILDTDHMSTLEWSTAFSRLKPVLHALFCLRR